jgi:transposase
MYDAMKRLQIQTLREASRTQEEVAAHTDVSVSTVRRVEREPRVTNPEDWQQRTATRMGRPSAVRAFAARVTEWLASERLLTIAVLERLRAEGYTGGKSAVYELVRELRGKTPTPVVARFEGVAGEFSQHDFGQVLVSFRRAGQERVRFFVSRLKFSRSTHVRLVRDETTETICHSLYEALRSWGGAPLQSVFDNPRTIVSRRQGHEITWQPTFARFCAEVGIVPRVTWPASPQQKGSVENLVGFVKSSFFKAHEFDDPDDLREKLAKWHIHVNDERPSRATGEIPRVRMLLEPYRYFAGSDLVGQVVTLHVGVSDVAIHAGLRRIALHPRHPINGRYSVLPEQRPQMLVKTGARIYVKRQLLTDLCPAAEWVLTEIRHRRPAIWKDEVERLFRLLEEHGEAATRGAFIEVAHRGVFGAEYVDAILAGHAAQEVAR